MAVSAIGYFNVLALPAADYVRVESAWTTL
jgi:hypothetical protein